MAVSRTDGGGLAIVCRAAATTCGICRIRAMALARLVSFGKRRLGQQHVDAAVDVVGVLARVFFVGPRVLVQPEGLFQVVLEDLEIDLAGPREPAVIDLAGQIGQGPPDAAAIHLPARRRKGLPAGRRSDGRPRPWRRRAAVGSTRRDSGGRTPPSLASSAAAAVADVASAMTIRIPGTKTCFICEVLRRTELIPSLGNKLESRL